MSLNNVYSTNRQGRRFLTPNGKEYKTIIKMITRNTVMRSGFKVISPNLGLYIEFGFTNFYNKSGSMNKKTRPDSSNLVKLLEDAIFEAIKLNDNVITDSHQTIVTRNCEKDYIKVKLVNL